MTVGGYEAKDSRYFDHQKFQLNSHRIAGSFHWQVKVNAIGFGGKSFTPKKPFALTDTGTTMTYMPE